RLAVRAAERFQVLAERRARLGLHRLVDRVLEVEREPVGLARHRLGEQFGTRSGDEELAAHRSYFNRFTIAWVNCFVLALPPRSPVRTLSLRSTSSTAFCTRFAFSCSPTWSSIIAAERINASGLAMPLPAMSGAE